MCAFDRNRPFDPPPLPPSVELETRAVLRKAASARAALGEFKGSSRQIPNPHILLDTLSLREANYSSEIENIVTTHDQLYREKLLDADDRSPAAKEVFLYHDALFHGVRCLTQSGFLSLNHILEVQRTLVGNSAGLRTQPGTALENSAKEVVYTPPQDRDLIRRLMENLVDYLNDTEGAVPDPLIRMATLHYQFETIHPFYDGNGRTGRILNILYLMLAGLLDQPTLYLSHYLIRHKGDYYRLLQAVRTDAAWEEWTLFMLEAVEQTAAEATQRVGHILALMKDSKRRMLENERIKKIYSKELLENLFRHPYTRIEYVEKDTGKTYQTARRYLEELCAEGFVKKYTMGRGNYYVNESLLKLLVEG